MKGHLEKHNEDRKKRSAWQIFIAAYTVWLRPIEFDKREQVAFIIINTIAINFVVLLTVWPETLISGVTPWIPALFGIATATPLGIFMMTLGGNSMRETLRLRKEMETISERLAKRNSELEVAKQELDQLANSDGLTGVANHRSFMKTLEKVFSGQKTEETHYWLAMMDLDGFKAINDAHGHDAGNSVLIEVATRLQFIFERHYGKVARLGGDEFAMLLSDPNNDDDSVVLRRARALCVYLSTGHSYQGHKLTVGVSIGMAKMDATIKTPRAFLTAADTALLDAKTQGKGRVCQYIRPQIATTKSNQELLRRG